MITIWMVLWGVIYAWFTVVATWWIIAKGAATTPMGRLNASEIVNSEFFSMIFILFFLVWAGFSIGLAIFYSWKLVVLIFVGLLVLRIVPALYRLIESVALWPFDWMANAILVGAITCSF